MSESGVKARRGVKKTTKRLNTPNDDTSYKTFGNNFVWVPDANEGFVIGEIVNRLGNECEVQTEAGAKLTLSRNDLQPINPPKFEGTPDMGNLTYLNEPSVLYNLKTRYSKNQIYTYSGLFLVAVNPYKSLPIYGPDVVNNYQGRKREERDPHIFAISDESYRQMLMNNSNQSMLITGESGAGKTENTKKVIQYLTSVAGQHAASGRGLLEEQILQANPVLESFGNAKTNKNNNSSRFGKFIEIQFNPGGMIAGANISTYLLEKSRVVRQGQGERNFHIFYQLVEGASAEEKARYKLGRYSDFYYLNNNNTPPQVEGMDDAKEFALTKKAMDIINFTKEEQDNVFAATAAILHMGNAEFVADSKGYAQVKDMTCVKNAAELLKVDANKLAQALIEPNIKVGGKGEIVRVPQTPDQSNYNRDALVKHLYGKLFDWVVAKINQSLTAKDKISTFIGVLDIAGFEIFKTNSFEQLCINYTNEKLQQFFNSHMFKKEQEEYIKEQIEWTFIDFGLDLQDTIDLIEKRGGILSLLDEQCLIGGSNEESLTLKFMQTHKDNSYFISHQFDKDKFGIQHYAGEVTYTTTNWINKNTDPLHEDCKTVVSLSNSGWVRAMFEGTGKDEGTSLIQNRGTGPRQGAGARFMTVSDFYKRQLSSLMGILESTEPHFIRCIIPNLFKKPGVIESNLVLEQLRCNGVLEGIRIARKGYPNRVQFEEFFKRYYILVASSVYENLTGFKAKSAAILTSIATIDQEKYKIGLSKIFFRTGELAKLEELREQKISEIIKTVQAAARGYLARQTFANLKAKSEALKLIQRNWRSYLELRDWSWYTLFMKIRPLLNTLKVEEELKDKENQINDLKKKLEEEAERKKQLDKNKQELESTIDKFKDEIYKNKEEQNKLNNKLAEFDAKLKELTDSLERESRNKQALEEAKKRLELTIMERDSKISDAQGKIANQSTGMDQLSRDLNALRQQLADMDGKYKSLTTDKQRVETELRDTQLRLADEQASGQKLNSKSSNLQRDVEELKEAVARLEKERAALDNEKKKLANELTTTKKLADATGKDKDQLGSEFKKIQGDNVRLESELEEEKRARAEIERRRKQLEGELSVANTTKEDLERERENLSRLRRQLESQLDEAKLHGDTLNEEKNQLQLLTQDQVRQLDDLKNQINKASANVAQLESQKTALERSLKELQAANEEELNKMKAQLEQTRRRLEGENIALKTQLEDSQRNASGLEKTKAGLERSLKEAGVALASESSAKASLEDLVRKLEAEIRELKIKLEEETRKRTEAERTVKRLQQEMSALKDQLQLEGTEKEKIERATANLKKQLDDVNAKLAEEEDEKHELTIMKEDLERKYNESQRQLGDKTNEVNKLNQQLAQLRKEMEETKSQLLTEQQQQANANLENLKKQLQAQVNDLQTQLNAAKDEAEKSKKKYKSDVPRLQQQVNDLQSQLNAATADAKRLSDELSSTKSSNEDVSRAKSELENAKRNLDAQLNREKLRADEAEAEKAKLADAKRKLEKDLADLKHELEEESEEKSLEAARADDNKSKADQLQRQLEDVNRKLNDLTEENSRIKGELNSSKDQSVTAQGKFAQELEALKRKLESANDEMKRQLDAEIAAKQDAIDQKKEAIADLKAAQREIANLKLNQGGASTEQVRQLEQQLAKAQSDLEEANRTKFGSESSLRSLEEKVRSLQSQLDDEARNRKRAEDAKKKAVGDLESVQEELDELEDMKSELAAAKADLEARVSQLASELSREKEERNSSSEQLNKYKKEADESVRALSEERIKAQEELKRLKRKFEADITELEETARRNLKSSSSSAKSEKKLLRQLEETQRRLDDESRSNSDNKDKATTYEKQYRNAVTEVERLKLLLRNIESDKSKTDSKVSELDDENERLKRELASLKTRFESEAKKRRATEKRFRSVMDSDDEL